MASTFRVRAPLLLVLAAACCPAIVLAQSTETSPAATPYDQAMDAYERNHWGRAFDSLAALADAGHGEAARLAWLMSRYGVALYRAQLDAEPARRARWLALAVGQPPATQLAANASTLIAGRQP